MNSVNLAKRLAAEGLFVFPVDEKKRPLTENGLHDGTDNPDVIDMYWSNNPGALVGVWCGASGIAVLDLDLKYDDNGTITKDGFNSIDRAWLDLPASFGYDSVSGNGRHIVYLAPEEVRLGPSVNYRGMSGVDRRAGDSYVVWASEEVPKLKDLAPAPEWFCDEAKLRTLQSFDGDLRDWYDSLTPGKPNGLVRRAINRISEDMGHSDMVAAQHEAVRLGAEGNPGVPELLEALENAFINRDSSLHSTPMEQWQYKFTEALISGVQKYGALTERLVNLPKYDVSMVPASVKDRQITGPSLSKPSFTQLLNKLVRETDNDDRVASILWNAAAPRGVAREWGIDFLYLRIEEARKLPQPETENPSLEESQKQEEAVKGLLTREERETLKYLPTFEDEYLSFAQGEGFANEKYTRAAAWAVASMGFGFRAFIPVTTTDKMGVNLWSMVLGESGTGKTRAIKFRDQCLEAMFPYVEGETGYDLGADSSVAGLHEALLNRDRKASFFGTDEASGFFKALSRDGGWQTGMDDVLSDWYEGKIRPSNKVRLKEMKGKSALTSFSIQMYATPDRLIGTLTRDQFMSGFLARFHWTIGDPPVHNDARFKLQQVETQQEFDEIPEVVGRIARKLIAAATQHDAETVAVIADEDALERIGEAGKVMYRSAEHRKNWDIIEPSITRLIEAVRKVAALNALNRGERRTRMADALAAIKTVEGWYQNLFHVAERISQGEYQKNLFDIENWIRGRGGVVTKPQLYHQFRDVVKRGKRELDDLLEFLLESGVLLRNEKGEGRIEYKINE